MVPPPWEASNVRCYTPPHRVRRHLFYNRLHRHCSMHAHDTRGEGAHCRVLFFVAARVRSKRAPRCTFSSSGIHESIRWQFARNTQLPSLEPSSIIRMAAGACPCPRATFAIFTPCTADSAWTCRGQTDAILGRIKYPHGRGARVVARNIINIFVWIEFTKRSLHFRAEG